MSLQNLLQVLVGLPLLALCLAVIARTVREIVHGPEAGKPDAARLGGRRRRVNW
jgi:hypothetical protein